MDLDFPSNMSDVWKDFNLKLHGDKELIDIGQ